MYKIRTGRQPAAQQRMPEEPATRRQQRVPSAGTVPSTK